MNKEKKWAYSFDKCDFYGPYYSREDAIRIGMNEARLEGYCQLYVGKCLYPKSMLEISKDDTLSLLRSLEERMSDDIEGWLITDQSEVLDLQLRLNKAFESWARKYKFNDYTFLVDDIEQFDLQDGTE